MVAAAALGVGAVGTAPNAQAAPGRATFTEILLPGSDPAAGRFPVLDHHLNLVNGKSFGLVTPGRFISTAYFAKEVDGDARAYVNPGELVYCIEPGVPVGPGAEQGSDYLRNFQMAGGEYVRQTYENNGEALVRALGLVMVHGYAERPTRADVEGWRWDNPVEGDRLAHLVATQILVWETSIGERNARFDHVPVPAGKDSISDLVFNRPNAPAEYQTYQNMIRARYDSIVAGVQGDLRMPDFVDNGQTYELQWDGNRFSTVLPNAMVATTAYSSDVVRSEPGPGPDDTTFWVDMEDLASAPNGPLGDYQVKATKKNAPSSLVVWGTPGDPGTQHMIVNATPATPITGQVKFKVAAGSIAANKVLGDHVDDSVTGAGIDYPGSPNWFEYTPVQNLSTNPVQTFDLIAGRDRLKVGTMTVTNNFDRTVTVSYALKQGLEGLTNDGTAHLALLNGVDELTTVAPGQQPYTMKDEQSMTLSLDGLTQTVTETTGKGKDKVTREVVKEIAPAINDIDNFIVYLHTNAKGVINTGYADYDTTFYVKVAGPSYPDGRVFPFSVNEPRQIHLAPGEYRIVEVANAQGDPLDGYWETSYSARKATVVAYEVAPVTITNKHDDDA